MRVCVCVHALRACYVLRVKCLMLVMLVRHVACASAWACAGQRYSPEDLPRPH
jgi:hypothetical protein